MITNPEGSHDLLLGCLLGTGVGDALGLASEGMTRRRIAARWRDGLRHRLVLRRGMFSDDTEHTIMVAAAMLRHAGDVIAFQRSLAWRLRSWFLCLPAGVGMATAKACIRLWLGFPVSKSGVRSAGNGAAMRSAVIGVFFRGDPGKRREFALAACRVTHTDPRAEESALMVAEAAALASWRAGSAECLAKLREFVVSEEMKSRFAALEEMGGKGAGVSEFAAAIGCGEGVSGFAPNTVAVALYAWLRHRGDFAAAVREVIACGGDTDTVAAITGGICGAETGAAAIPREWVEGIVDWPLSVSRIRGLATALAEQRGSGPRLFLPEVPLRNLIFLGVVLAHGFRRLFPPY